ncbi:hypothetical protein PVAR5_5483 [Paecilomyces variotii No. 5]|uniref:Uncharacterized protein n=1 Tax=Byssochlamys spectabilis (strain No. 5 / NBRC 109023) TaxID=1356009 RepID=V5FXJ0_BYSSN|nr:hypothetical protein PVAR5_5483 [Paecilomyces variotii No. 5]
MATLLSFKSPKRKRETSESECYSPSASPPSTISISSFQEACLREEEGGYSPRTAVAGRLRELAIRGEYVPNPDFEIYDSIEHIKRPSSQVSFSLDTSGDADMPASSSSAQSDHVSSAESNAISDIHETESGLKTPTSSTNSTPSRSPRKKRPIKQPMKPRSRRKSPPLTGNAGEDPLTWHDSEITGHEPNDPNDDGYGINGIGFKPTAAIAWARSQKRQKQVSDWKNREAREERERRRERREGMSRENTGNGPERTVQKRVKFSTDDLVH